MTSFVLPDDARVSTGLHTILGGWGLPKRAVAVHGRAVAQGAVVRPLQRAQAPFLERALADISKNCLQRDVHADGCEFEDEGVALLPWKAEDGYPSTLTIHCQTDGELACLGPFANAIEGRCADKHVGKR
jgi:hypothetical protein